jgi:hypothetical protein
MKKTPNYANFFECIPCNFKCSKKSDWDRHSSTSKHYNRTNLEQNYAEKSQTFKCSHCNKEYSARNSLWYHKKNCKEPTVAEVFANNNTQQITELMLKMIEQNKDLTDKIVELAKNNTTNYNNTNNVNSHNKFNLNLFLNEQCKDAINISDFVN